MFHSLTAHVTVPVILVPLQRVSVLLIPPLEGEVRKESMVGVRLLVIPRRSRTGVILVMMKLFVFALLVTLLAARSLLFF